MVNTWVVVADSSRARIFTLESPRGPLQELEVLVHPEARLHVQDLTSDLPGRAFDRAGQGRHALGQSVGPKEQEALKFAKQLADHLNSARVSARYDRLILIAAPRFLGQLRQCLSGPTAALITEEIAKDLSQHRAEEIRGQLPERL